MNAAFFRFIQACSKLLGIEDVEKQAELVEDPSWFFCYDDGMTPEEAVKKYLAKTKN